MSFKRKEQATNLMSKINAENSRLSILITRSKNWKSQITETSISCMHVWHLPIQPTDAIYLLFYIVNGRIHIGYKKQKDFNFLIRQWFSDLTSFS